jgi:uncharacterized protein (DUF58 family)
MLNQSWNRLITLVIGVSALIFIGLVSRQSGPLLLAAPLLAYLFVSVLFSPRQAQLSARRRLKILNAAGEVILDSADLQHLKPEWVVPSNGSVEVGLVVVNQGPALAEITLEDNLHHYLASMDSDASLEWHYHFTPRRGRFQFRDLQYHHSDPFGLFFVKGTLPAEVSGSKRAVLLVLPQSLPLKRLPLRPRMLRGFAGPVAARAPGSGTDFFGVREYHPGDPLRHINWRLSSRDEEHLYTDEVEGERFADIGLILDARSSHNLVGEQGEIFESSVTAAASMARALLRDGHRVSLLVYGFGIERVLPGSGRQHVERILRGLAAASPQHHYALESLRYIPTRMFPARSQIIFVSPLSVDDYAPLVNFRALGYQVLVVSPNPVDFELQTYQSGASAHGDWSRDGSPRGDVSRALRLATIERTVLFRRLERIGVWVVDWPVSQPLNQVLQARLAPLRWGRQVRV